jgi:tellurite resistance protein TerC
MTSVFWVIFLAVVIFMMILDLGVFSRESHKVGFREAVLWSIAWIGAALLFNVGIFWKIGSERALLFATGYLVELSLSVDNLFVFLVIFNYFDVPHKHRHKVLFWGIIGAIVLRCLLIWAGISLIQRFHWFIYVFGIFLVFTGFKLIRDAKKESDPSQNIVIRFARRILPFRATFAGGRFIVKENGKRVATTMLFVLLVVEMTDLVFALDSIPAILAITSDPFIIITSNIFAVVGLRALFFTLAGFMYKFQYLKNGLAFILVFIGLKMLTSDFYSIPVKWSLVVIAGILILSIAASVIWPISPVPKSSGPPPKDV